MTEEYMLDKGLNRGWKRVLLERQADKEAAVLIGLTWSR